jgi:thioredoxin-related protein
MRIFKNAMAAALVLCLAALRATAGELVMVEQDGCHWCAAWNRELGHIYPRTEEGRRAPLRRVNLHDLPEDIAFASRPIFTPTFVLVEDGRELGRMEGYAGDQFFWFILGRLLDEHGIEEGPSQ